MTTDDEAAVDDLIAHTTPARRQRDARTLLELYGRVTGQPARRWGTIVGYGHYHYRYDSGREGDTAAAGFAPRKAATTIYLVDGIGRHETNLARLGPHRTGVGCLYVTNLDDIDLEVLEQIIRESYEALTAGVWTTRARDAREDPAKG